MCLLLDRAAELVLRDVRDHGRVRLVADPGVVGQVDGAAGLAAGLPLRPRADLAASDTLVSVAARRSAHRAPQLVASRVVFISSGQSVLSGRACGRGLGDPVEHDAEQHDGQAGRQALAEQLQLREAGDHVVARARPPPTRPPTTTIDST